MVHVYNYSGYQHLNLKGEDQKTHNLFSHLGSFRNQLMDNLIFIGPLQARRAIETV